MRVLLIENDPAYAPVIELMMKAEGFNVYTTDEGQEGVELGTLYDYDAIVLSSTPDRTDCDMVKSLRLAKVKAAIVILTTAPGIEHTVRALGMGADDVLSKPFHRDELLARIHATVRRSKGHAHSTITTGNLVVNIDAKTVTVGGNPVYLTVKEFALVELLSLHKNHTVTKEMILNRLYGGLDEPDAKIVDVFVCKLRKKIGAGIVETVWGRGYCLRDADTPKVGAPIATNPVGRHEVEFDKMSVA